MRLVIFYSGAGILGLLIPAALTFGGLFLAGAISTSSVVMTIGMIVGAILGCAATWFLGNYMNHKRPAEKLAARMTQRTAELHAMADAGTFTRGPAYPTPTSLAEAHQQVEQQALDEYAALEKNNHNEHTLFFIPMQYWAFICGAIALIFAVFSFM